MGLDDDAGSGAGAGEDARYRAGSAMAVTLAAACSGRGRHESEPGGPLLGASDPAGQPPPNLYATAAMTRKNSQSGCIFPGSNRSLLSRILLNRPYDARGTSGRRQLRPGRRGEMTTGADETREGAHRRRPGAFDRDDDLGRLQKAAADGDQSAWRALVERFSPLVWSVSRAHRLSFTDGQDVYQYVWLTLTENLGRIKDPAALGGWLYTVTRNECLRVLGRSGRQILTDDVIEPEHLDESGYADAFVLLEARNAELWREVDHLPDRCRSLLRALVADPPPSYEEVASRLEIRIGSVGPTRQRCLERLRRSLALIRIKQDQDDL